MGKYIGGDLWTRNMAILTCTSKILWHVATLGSFSPKKGVITEHTF